MRTSLLTWTPACRGSRRKRLGATRPFPDPFGIPRRDGIERLSVLVYLSARDSRASLSSVHWLKIDAGGRGGKRDCNVVQRKDTSRKRWRHARGEGGTIKQPGYLCKVFREKRFKTGAELKELGPSPKAAAKKQLKKRKSRADTPRPRGMWLYWSIHAGECSKEFPQAGGRDCLFSAVFESARWEISRWPKCRLMFTYPVKLNRVIHLSLTTPWDTFG